MVLQLPNAMTEPFPTPSASIQQKHGTEIYDVSCKNPQHQLTFFKDGSRSICTTFDTWEKLYERGWAMKKPMIDFEQINNDPNAIRGTCTEGGHLIQGGYRPSIDYEFQLIEYRIINDVQVMEFEKIPIDMGSARANPHGHAMYGDCINENIDNFLDCKLATHYRDKSNFPIITCLTVDGKLFSINWDEQMKIAKAQRAKDIILFTFQHEEELGLPVYDEEKNKIAMQAKQQLRDKLAEQSEIHGKEHIREKLPWVGIGYDPWRNALKVEIHHEKYNEDNAQIYADLIRWYTGYYYDLVVRPGDMAVPT